jgi:hypothetical protein
MKTIYIALVALAFGFGVIIDHLGASFFAPEPAHASITAYGGSATFCFYGSDGNPILLGLAVDSQVDEGSTDILIGSNKGAFNVTGAFFGDSDNDGPIGHVSFSDGAFVIRCQPSIEAYNP